MQVFNGLDEMGLTQDHVHRIGFFDFYRTQFHETPPLCPEVYRNNEYFGFHIVGDQGAPPIVAQTNGAYLIKLS